MTPWNVTTTTHARHELRRLDRQAAVRIAAAIDRFSQTGEGDVRTIEGRAVQVARYRLRVGEWRVLFDLDEEAGEMIIRRVRPRGSAYTDL